MINRASSPPLTSHDHQSAAAVLGNLGNRLAAAGHAAESLSIASEAVEVHRSIEVGDVRVRASSLALALTNYSLKLRNAGKHQEAIEASVEAVRITRPLATTAPVVFQLDLVRCLANLASVLVAARRPESGIAAGLEAISLCEGATFGNQSEAGSALASAYLAVGSGHVALARQSDAIAYGAKAIAILKELATGGAVRSAIFLFEAIEAYCLWSVDAGSIELALSESAYHTDLARSIYISTGIGIDRIAGSLNNRANLLSQAGLHNEAFSVASEAVFYWRSATSDRLNVKSELAVALGNLAMRALTVGERKIFEYRQTEALQILDRGDMPTERLMTAIRNSIAASRFAGSRNADKLAERALLAARRLADREHVFFAPVLARVVATYAASCIMTGLSWDNAVDAILEAMCIILTFRTAFPNVFGDDLLVAINLTAGLLDITGMAGSRALSAILRKQLPLFLRMSSITDSD